MSHGASSEPQQQPASQQQPSQGLKRRTFLAAAGGVAAASAAQLSAKRYARGVGSNDRLGVGLTGGWVMGKSHTGLINNLKEKNTLQPFGVSAFWKQRTVVR